MKAYETTGNIEKGLFPEIDMGEVFRMLWYSMKKEGLEEGFKMTLKVEPLDDPQNGVVRVPDV